MTVIRKLGNLFIFTLFGTFLGTVVSVIVTQLYNSAARLFPKTFPLYNVVLESEKHAAQEQRLSFIALFLTVVLVVYVTERSELKHENSPKSNFKHQDLNFNNGKHPKMI